MRRFFNYLYIKLVFPFTETQAPIYSVCWGATIGMFIAMTPTVGVQMYCVTIFWAISRYGFGFKINLPIALTMTWITNPITVFPFYYFFLVTGEWIFHFPTPVPEFYSYQDFLEIFDGLRAGTGQYVEIRHRIVNGIMVLFWRFGWPLFVGGVAWALVLSVITFPLTFVLLSRYRQYLARQEGLSYEEWRRVHIH